MTNTSEWELKLKQAEADKAAIQKNIDEIKKKIDDEKFKHFEVTIPIKNKEQAYWIFSIFNHTCITDELYNVGFDSRAVRRSIDDRSNEFNYYPVFDILNQRIKEYK